MSVGFRKSLFGFNSNDVMEYIDSLHKSFVNKEKELNSTLQNLEDQLKSSKEAYDALDVEKQKIEKQLADFNAKYDDIERLSENIGKLYIVAQTNAKVIMENSESSAEIATKEVSRNMYAISDAHESLMELRQSIIKTSDNFVAEVDKLMASLNDTRQKIVDNAESAEEARQQFSDVFKSIVG